MSQKKTVRVAAVKLRTILISAGKRPLACLFALKIIDMPREEVVAIFEV